MEINIVTKLATYKVVTKMGIKHLQPMGKPVERSREAVEKADEDQLVSDFLRQTAIDVARYNEKEQLIAMEGNKPGKIVKITQKYVQ